MKAAYVASQLITLEMAIKGGRKDWLLMKDKLTLAGSTRKKQKTWRKTDTISKSLHVGATQGRGTQPQSSHSREKSLFIFLFTLYCV